MNAQTQNIKVPTKTVTIKAQAPRIQVVPNLSRPLSLTRIEDYWRLFYWFLWFPQALRSYIERYSHNEDDEHWYDLQWMTGTITVVVSAVVSFLAVIALRLADPAALGAVGTVYGAMAWALGLLAMALSFTVLVYFGGMYTPFLLVPTISAFTIVMSFGFLRILRTPAAQYWEFATLFGVMGIFCGLMYSQVIAYRSRQGMPYKRTLPAVAVIFSVAALALALVVIEIFPHGVTGQDYLTDVLVVTLASIVGFLTTVGRIDDLIKAWIHTKTSAAPVVYPPKISLVRFGPLRDALEAKPTDKWPTAVQEAADVWRYTQQQRVVANYLYWALEASPAEVKNDRLVVVTDQSLPWKDPILLVDGGDRDLQQIVWRVTGMKLVHELPKKGESLGEVNSYLVIAQICKDAETLDQAIDQILDVSQEKDEMPVIQMLNALKALKGGDAPAGRADLSTEQLKLKKSITPDMLHNPAWQIINELLGIYHYAWLASRCQDAGYREDGALYVERQLQTQLAAVNAARVHACVQRFLREVIEKWGSDMESMRREHYGYMAASMTNGYQPNPFRYDGPIRDITKLVDRTEQVERLREAWRDEHLQVVEIAAPILCGSTSFFFAAANVIAGESKSLNIAYVSVGHLSSDEQATKKLATGLYDELSRYLRGWAPTYEELVREPRRTLELMFRTICASGKLVVAFDDVDHLEKVIGQFDELRRNMQFIFHLNEIIPNFGVAMIGTVDRADRYRRLRSYTTRFARTIQLDAIGSVQKPADVARFLNEPFAEVATRFTPEAITRALELSGGVPYLVQVIAWNLYEPLRYPPQEEGYTPDPLFTVESVMRVLELNAFKLGWKYYVHRLQAYFGNDWKLAFTVISRLAADPSKPLKPEAFAIRKRGTSGGMTVARGGRPAEPAQHAVRRPQSRWGLHAARGIDEPGFAENNQRQRRSHLGVMRRRCLAAPEMAPFRSVHHSL